MLKVDNLFLFIDMCCAHFLQSHNLQDSHEREYINCDRYFQQVRKTLLIIHGESSFLQCNEKTLKVNPFSREKLKVVIYEM